MDSWATGHRLQRVQAPQHEPLVSGSLQPPIRPHPPQHSEHQIEQNHSESSAKNVLGRI